MKDVRKTQIKVGLFSLLALVMLVWILSWAKNYKLSAGQKTVTIRFESVNGLEKGDIVTVNGVRKGSVDEITISGNTALVNAKLDEDVVLKEDASFGVSMLDLMGGKKVEIRPGTSERQLDYSKIQNGTFYADVPAVMAMLGSVQEDLVSIVRELQVTLKSTNKILEDEAFHRDLKTSLANLSDISQKVNKMIDENRSNLKQLTANANELSKEATVFLKNNKDNVHKSLEELQVVLKNTNELIGKVNKLADETTARENNAGRLLYDEELMSDIKTSLQQVKELTKILNDQLKDQGLNVDAHIKLF